MPRIYSTHTNINVHKQKIYSHSVPISIHPILLPLKTYSLTLALPPQSAHLGPTSAAVASGGGASAAFVAAVARDNDCGHGASSPLALAQPHLHLHPPQPHR